MVKNLDQNMGTYLKWALASIIISMGGFGYYRFFSGFESNSEPVYFVVILFVIIESAILKLTLQQS